MAQCRCPASVHASNSSCSSGMIPPGTWRGSTSYRSNRRCSAMPRSCVSGAAWKHEGAVAHLSREEAAAREALDVWLLASSNEVTAPERREPLREAVP